MRKLVLLPVLASLWVASPAWAINDPDVPATGCAASHSEAVGHPAGPALNGTPAGPVPNPGNSEAGLAHNDADASCANAG